MKGKVKRVTKDGIRTLFLETEHAAREIVEYYNCTHDVSLEDIKNVAHELEKGLAMDTSSHDYFFINPVDDFVDNIDDVEEDET